MWRSGTNVKSYNQEYTRFCDYLKDCKICPQQQQSMRKPPIKTGRQVQFKNDDSRKKVSYIDKMKVKIDSPVGRRHLFIQGMANDSAVSNSLSSK
ncbi:hypothetical protein PTUN_a2195 [Pseudoalteromonas tunicata]|nr:hypothetical protein PTUN_a2195 [Pseudoalteromonas tunicata]